MMTLYQKCNTMKIVRVNFIRKILLPEFWLELLRVNIIFSGKEMIESKEKNHDKVRVIQIFRVIWSYVKH